jgi:hypothetical protein
MCAELPMTAAGHRIVRSPLMRAEKNRIVATARSRRIELRQAEQQKQRATDG